MLKLRVLTIMADSRRRLQQIYDERFLREQGMRHGSASGLISSTHRSTDQHVFNDHGEATLAAQRTEIERLASDSRMLATSHIALREDLIASQREIQRLGGYISRIETEGDIQIRRLLEKMAKMEVDLRGGESVKTEYRNEHMEAQRLVIQREELMAQIQQKTNEFEKASDDIKRLPDMHNELGDLRQEHQRLRTSFQYEKGLNVDKVGKMQLMEKDLVGMAREVEMLRAEVSNAENRARAPSPYPDPFTPSNTVHTPIPNNGPFVHQTPGISRDGIGPHGASGTTMYGRAYDAPPLPR